MARQRFLEENLWLPPVALVVAPTTSERQRFLEENLWLPTGDAPAFVADQFTYREDHRASAQDPYPYIIQGTQYPAGGVQVGNNTSDYGTVFDPYILQGSQAMSMSGTVPAFVADQFTYREDHRASAPASVAGFLPSVTGLVVYA